MWKLLRDGPNEMAYQLYYGSLVYSRYASLVDAARDVNMMIRVREKQIKVAKKHLKKLKAIDLSPTIL